MKYRTRSKPFRIQTSAGMRYICFDKEIGTYSEASYFEVKRANQRRRSDSKAGG